MTDILMLPVISPRNILISISSYPILTFPVLSEHVLVQPQVSCFFAVSVFKSLVTILITFSCTLLKSSQSLEYLGSIPILIVFEEPLIKQLLDNVIQDNVGNSFQSILDDIKFYTIKNKTVCKIIVKGRGPFPVFVKKKERNQPSYDAFYIRCQASTRELKGDERDEYIKHNWRIIE